MTQCELQEEKEQIEDLERQRVECLNRAERIAERLTTLKAEHKLHVAEATLTSIVKDADKLGHNGVVERAQECLWILQSI